MAGFSKTDDAPVETKTEDIPDAKNEPSQDEADQEVKKEVEEIVSTETVSTEDDRASQSPDDVDKSPVKETAPTQYWRWIGMGKAKGGGRNKSHRKKPPKNRNAQTGGQKPHGKKAEPVLATGGGAFDELAALKKAMKK